MSQYKEENRRRLIDLLSKIDSVESPVGWSKVSRLSVGGLVTAGFSKVEKNLLVIVSSSGRSVVDCRSGEKVARDYEAYQGFDMAGLTCLGIGPIQDELVSVCGLGGGGLPYIGSANETLEIVSPDWPESDLVFCPPGKHPLIAGSQSGCVIVYKGDIRACGFSWCGNFFIAACGSDIDIWRRERAL